MSLSIIETLVVFVGIPLLVVAVITGLIFAGSARTNDRRYRPGRPFDFTPVWFLSAPDAQGPAPAELEAAPRRELVTAEHGTVGDVTGGASDRW